MIFCVYDDCLLLAAKLHSTSHSFSAFASFVRTCMYRKHIVLSLLTQGPLSGQITVCPLSHLMAGQCCPAEVQRKSAESLLRQLSLLHRPALNLVV